jgi:hypothetical protein
VLYVTNYFLGHPMKKMVKTLKNPNCVLLQMERHILPPKRWDTHGQISKVPLYLSKSSHRNLMLNFYRCISATPSARISTGRDATLSA